MSKLSPIQTLLNRNGLNINPAIQKNLLNYAVNKPKDLNIEESADRTNLIPVTNFKSNKLSHIDKKQRAEQVQKMLLEGLDEPCSPTKFESIRLPNKITKHNKDVGDSTVHIATQEIQSPTQFLRGHSLSPIDNFFASDDKNSI